MPTFESMSAVKGETSKVESESDVKEESKSATQTKDVAENVNVPKVETLPAKDESWKKELVEVTATDLPLRSIAKSESKLEESESKLEECESKLEECESKLEESESKLKECERKLEESERKLEESERKLEESERKLEESERKLEESERKLEESERKLEKCERKLEGSERKLEGSERKLEGSESKLEGSESKLEGSESKLEGSESKLEGSERKLEVAVVEQSLKKFEVTVITGAEESSATEESADVSTIKEACGGIAKTESAIKIEEVVVVESDVSSTKQESGFIIAKEKMIMEEHNVESNLAKAGTTSRYEPVTSKEKVISQNLQHETTEKEAQLRPSCLIVGSSELMYEDTHKISDATARLNKRQGLYDGHQIKQLNIPAPDFDYVPSHADPTLRKRFDFSQYSVDVSLFNWSNISLHVVDNQLNIACKQEHEFINCHEFHKMNFKCPIPVGCDVDDITVCITANRRLVIHMPITKPKTVESSK